MQTVLPRNTKSSYNIHTEMNGYTKKRERHCTLHLTTTNVLKTERENIIIWVRWTKEKTIFRVSPPGQTFTHTIDKNHNPHTRRTLKLTIQLFILFNPAGMEIALGNQERESKYRRRSLLDGSIYPLSFLIWISQYNLEKTDNEVSYF